MTSEAATAEAPGLLTTVTDAQQLRRVFTLYPHGVMAVAASIDGEPVGLAVSAFVSVSLDPALVVLCIDKASSTWPRLRDAPALGVSVLAESQLWLCKQLASRRSDRFAGAPFTPAASGALLLQHSPAALECTIESTMEGGDHLIVALRVQTMAGDPTVRPLVWYDSGYAGLAPLD